MQHYYSHWNSNNKQTKITQEACELTPIELIKNRGVVLIQQKWRDGLELTR